MVALLPRDNSYLMIVNLRDGTDDSDGRRRSHHRSDAQKAFMCRVAEICAKAGISQATYIDWKKKSGLRTLS
ncbi:hypothetical protein GOC54_02955 [Sinorhizobium meliloti]|nr:hypothetical protein [Sinorhizobium meliloti]MDW9569074.1 hypothetical protein [Sinorhizobium meliloti]MDX0165653.1 hypothetical protein [Sinorhizobium meliloti]MDX0310087.1 hypothetical protein [Sinorhizobium meliloti]